MTAETPSWYVKTEDGKVYGPATVAALIEWAKDGRIQPTGFLSQNRIDWKPSHLKPELEMKWFVEPSPGKSFGPFNRAFVDRLLADGSVERDAEIYCRNEEKVVEKVVERVVRVEVPVEKVVEKIVEVPVEKIVEKIVRVEVPVEKVVEKIVEVPVEKVVEKEVRVEVPVEKVIVKEVRVEVPVEKVVEKIVEIPVEKIVEKEVRIEVPVEKIVEVPVPQPAGEPDVIEPEVVEPEVAEPADSAPPPPPPPPSPGAIFKGLDRNSLAALEAAARRELSMGRRFGMGGGMFGRKK